MGLGEDLLVILSSYSEGYRLMRARAYGFSYKDKRTRSEDVDRASIGALRVTLHRLKKKGLVESSDRGIWKMTAKGREYLSEKLHFMERSRKKTAARNRTKNMIVAFDIPEREKKKRDWIRAELVRLGFVLLQKSLWFGPSPVPEEFLTSLHDLRIIPYIKFFKAEIADII